MQMRAAHTNLSNEGEIQPVPHLDRLSQKEKRTSRNKNYFPSGAPCTEPVRRLISTRSQPQCEKSRSGLALLSMQMRAARTTDATHAFLTWAEESSIL